MSATTALTSAFQRSARIGMVLTFVSAVAVGFTGHALAQVMTQEQPMKMAAAEALWNTESPAGFSLFAVGDVGTETGKNSFNVTVPHALSILATNTWDGQVQGINDLQKQYIAKYGPGDYRPDSATGHAGVDESRDARTWSCGAPAVGRYVARRDEHLRDLGQKR